MSLDTLAGGANSSKSTRKGIAILGGTSAPAATDAVGLTKLPEIKTPPVPTIDEARRERQETDRIRRRRGVLANISAGNNAAAPTLGTRTALGA